MNTIHQPLLDPAEVTSLISRASGWQGSLLPWSDRVSAHGTSGANSSQQRGSGLDFVESRPYQIGDEPRHIDWRATARSGRPYVRIFHEEQTPSACFLLDRRPSMLFGTRRRLKVTQAARLAVFLAAFEARRGAEIGAMTLTDTIHWLPPISGLTGIQHIAQLVSEACPPARQSTGISLDKALSHLAEHLPDGTNIYLLSDFHDLSDRVLPALSQLGQLHNVRALNIHDDAESSLPRAGILKLSWSDTSLMIDSDNEQTRNNYIDWANRQSAQINSLFSRCGIRIDALSSSVDDIVEWLRDPVS